MKLQLVLKCIVLVSITFGIGKAYSKDSLYQCPKFSNLAVSATAAFTLAKSKSPVYGKPMPVYKYGSHAYILGIALSGYKKEISNLAKKGIQRCAGQLSLNQESCWEVSIDMPKSPYQLEGGKVYDGKNASLNKLNSNRKPAVFTSGGGFAVPKIPAHKKYLKIFNCRSVEYVSETDREMRFDLNNTIADLENNYSQQSVNMQNIEKLQMENKALRQELDELKAQIK